MEITLNVNELYEFLRKNKDFIVWERHNRHLLDTYNTLMSPKSSTSSPLPNMRKIRSSVVVEHVKTVYEFKILKKVMDLKEGNGFGELALI